MGVKATEFGSILIEKHVGFRGELKWPEAFLPTKLVGDGTFGRMADDKFGTAVSVDGDLAVVGVPSQDYDENGELTLAEAGVVFVYRRTRESWEFAYRISAPADDRASQDNFGYAVGLKGNTLIVGAPRNATNALKANPVEGAGAAFVYELTNTEYTFQQKLTAASRDVADNFGSTVTAQDDVVFVGSYAHGRDEQDTLDAPEAGAVWAYARTNGTQWVLQKKITASGNARNAFDKFGQTVGAHKNVLVVGAPEYDFITKGTDKRDNAGIAYVFGWETDHWEIRQTLFPEDREAGDRFGFAVSVFEDKIAIGAPGKNGNIGKVYQYVRDPASLLYKVVSEVEPTQMVLPAEYVQPTDFELIQNAQFGSAVSQNATHLVVGAPTQASLNISSINTGVTPHTYVGNVVENAGYAYVYGIDVAGVLSLQNKFTGADRFGPVNNKSEDGQYGFSVSMGSSILVVGEPYASFSAAGTNNQSDAGLAHVYLLDNNTYAYSKTLEGFYVDRNIGDAFATDFASSERFVVFTAPAQDYDANNENYLENSGAAYIWEFVGGSWTFMQKIVASDRIAGLNFGTKTTVLNDRIYVSANDTTAVGSTYVFQLQNGKFVQTQKIKPAGLPTNTKFGENLLAADNRLFIASLHMGVAGAANHGSVWAYTLNSATNTYELDTQLSPKGLVNIDSSFGISMAINENVLVVGAPGHNFDKSDATELTRSGAAFVFAKNNGVWAQIDKLSGPGNDRESFDYMGYSVSAFGDTLAVGIPHANLDLSQGSFLNNAGKVYFYKRVDGVWESAGGIVSPARVESGKFGYSLSLGETLIAVGAPGETAEFYNDTIGFGNGRVYVYEKQFSDWVLVGTLENNEFMNQTAPRRFGYSVALDGSRIIVGEPGSATSQINEVSLNNAGAAWIFERNGTAWLNRGKLTQDQLAGRWSGAVFGFSVDIKGDLAVVGAPFDQQDSNANNLLTNAGSVNIFRRTVSPTGVVSWLPEKKLAGIPLERNTGDGLGSVVASNNRYVAVSALGHDYDVNRENLSEGAGAVYIYEWVNNSLNFLQKVVAFEAGDRYEGAGFGATLSMSETHLIVGSPTFSLDLTGTPGNRQFGKVWSFKLSNGLFVKERTFRAPNPADVDPASPAQARFGFSVSVDGNTLAIGASDAYFGDSTSLVRSGFVATYAYEADKWVLKQTIQPPSREASDYFGTTVLIKNNTLVVGGTAGNSSTPSGGFDGTTISGGAVWFYVLEENVWNFVHKVVRGGGDRLVEDQFGSSVSIDGDYMVVGAPNMTLDSYTNAGALNAGAAYVFKKDVDAGWVFSRKLLAPTRKTDALFGFSVALKDNIIVVGAPGEDATYVFRQNTNVKIHKTRRTARFAGVSASQDFIVPQNVTKLTAYIWGASGANYTSESQAGNGGFVRATFDVTEGETLTVNVGMKPVGAGAGGGRSEILRGSSTLMVAGGGGGSTSFSSYSTYPSTGGAAGENGYSGNQNTLPGRAGTSTNGGSAATSDNTNWWVGNAGSFKQGGDSNADPLATVFPGGWPNGGRSAIRGTTYGVGGGGDGWYGGSAGSILKTTDGAGFVAPGGGGSSYVAPGIQGYISTVKTEYEDHLQILGNEVTKRPGVNSDGYILLEYYIETPTEDWDFEQRLGPTRLNTTLPMRFGETLGFDGTSIAIGSPNYTFKKDGSSWGTANGVVSVYDYNGFEWSLANNVYPFGLNGNHDANNGSYAKSISVHGDIMVVGAYAANHDSAGINVVVDAGIVFAYRKDNGVWKPLERVAPPGGSRNAGDLIGTSIATFGDWVAVGAPGHSFNDAHMNQVINSGSVFMWKWTAGSLNFDQVVTAPASFRDYRGSFGSDVIIDETSMIVAAPGYMVTETTMQTEGQVFEFILVDGKWEFNQRFTQPLTTANNAFFGGAIARDGNTLAIAANSTLLSTISLGATTSLAYSLKDTTLPTESKVWSLEFRAGKPSLGTSEAFGTLNFASRVPGSFSYGSFGSGLRVYGYDKNGTQVMLAGLNVATNSTHTVVIKRTATNLLQVFVNGVQTYSQNIVTAGFDVPMDFENGYSLSSYGATRATYSFIRLSYEDVNATLNQGAEIGRRPTTRFFANFGIDTVDLANNYDVEEIVTIDADPDYYFTVDTGVDSPFENGGQVYVYDRVDSEWQLSQTVKSWAPTTATDHFGSSLNLKNDMLLVGAYGHGLDQSDTNLKAAAGAVFFFKRNNGVFEKQHKLVGWGHDIAGGDLAGDTIVSNGTTIAVAAPGHPYDADGNNYLIGAGAVYIWRNESDNWIFEQKISAPIRAANDAFGKVMALNGTTLVVGVPGSSKAWVFEKDLGSTLVNCWSTGVELIPVGPNSSTPGGTLGFGFSVGVDAADKEIIVGAPGHQYDFTGENPIANAGAAFVFAKEDNAWVFKQKLSNNGISLETNYGVGRQADDNFGWSVGIAGNIAMVGSPNYDYDAQGQRLLSGTGVVVAFTRADSTALWNQFQIVASQSEFREPGDNYGTAIASNNTFVAVGTPSFGYDDRGYDYLVNSGMVAIWQITDTTWNLVQKLHAGVNRKANALFGFSLAMHGDTLIVGAPSGNNTMLGEVFEYTLTDGIYEFTNKIQDTQNNTNSPANQLFQAFGFAVDFDGTTLLIGNPNRGTAYQGQAHLYEKQENAWVLLQNIRYAQTGNSAVTNTSYGSSNLGQSVSVSGNIAAVGNWNHDASDANTIRGAVLIWMKNNGTWESSDRVVSQLPSRESGEQFGYAIGASGDYMAVGAPTSNHGALNRRAITAYNNLTTNSGAVLIFKKNEANAYEFYQRISPRTGTFDYNGGDQFGYSLAIEGDTLLVGAPYHQYNQIGANPVVGAGAVFEFRLDANENWMQTAKIVAQGYMARQVNDFFGQNLVYEDRTLAVGAGNHNYGKTASDSTGSDIGAVYVYRRIDDAWFFVDKAIGEEPNISRRSGYAAGKNAMALHNGWLATTLVGANLDALGTDALTNAGAIMIHKIDSLDRLQVKLLGATYNQPAQTSIAFNTTTGLYQGVTVLNSGSGYTASPEVLFSNEEFEGYALLQPTEVQSIELVNLDSTVDVAPTLTIVRDANDTTGAGATAILTRANPTIGTITVTSPGSGYTVAPTVTVTNSTGVELIAVLQQSYVTELNLLTSTGGFTETPTVTFTMPASGETATGHAIMDIESLILAQTDKSYVGERMELVMDGTPAQIEITSVDANRNIVDFDVIDSGVFTTGSSVAIPAKRIITTDDYGSVTESTGTSQVEDYGTLFSTATNSQTDRGQVSSPNTSAVDYGFVTDEPTSTTDNGRILTKNVTGSEDYGLITGAVTGTQDYMENATTVRYGSITETTSSKVYLGSISETVATFNASLDIKALVLDNPGFGYRSVPRVAIQTIGLATATASAMIAPVGVDSVSIVNKGEINSNSVITFSGANKPTAEFSIIPGEFSGVTVTNGGSGYTRTPRIVFSNPDFTARVKLRPTGVASVVTTKQNSSLTLVGNVKYKKYITEPNSLRRDNQNFGTAITGYGQTVVVGSPMTGSSSAQSSYSAGQVAVFDTTITADRGNKIDVNGYMDASSVLNDITGDFTINLWFKTTMKARAANFGSFLSGRNSGAGLKNAHLLWIDQTGIVRVAGETAYDIIGFVDPDSAWHNVTYKSEGDKVHVYWDGSLLGSTTRNAADMDMLVLGAQFRNSDTVEPTRKAFRGYMSDIAVWNTALTDVQIQNVVSNGASTISANLIALWSGN